MMMDTTNNNVYPSYGDDLCTDQPYTGVVNGNMNDGSAAFTGGALKAQASNKSKKSLNSIVARLSNQSQPRISESQQFMAALSLTERVAPSPPIPTYKVSHEDMSGADVALDLSIKKPLRVSHSRDVASFQARTDSIGALDLSLSGQRDSKPEMRKESPDFVLDLTQSTSQYSTSSASEGNRYSILSTQRGTRSPSLPHNSTPSPSLTRNSQEKGGNAFHANHKRVLQFLANHTITQRIAGPDVDIELLTCRYCKYASTEKSCMMAHLSTVHLSKRRGGRRDKNRPPPSQHSDRVQPSQGSGTKSEGYVQRLPPSLVIPQYKKRNNHKEPTNHQSARNNPRAQFQQLSQLGDDGSLTFLPTPVVNLSPLVKQDTSLTVVQPALSLNAASPSISPKMLQKPSPSQKTSPSLSSRGSSDGEYTLPANQVAYLGEDGRIYLLPQSSPVSMLEERLTMNSPRESPTSAGFGAAPVVMPNPSFNVGNSPVSAEDVQRQLKLNNLCKKLAKRMDKDKNRSHVFNKLDQQSAQSSRQQTAIKGRRRKSSGNSGKRQHLIAQTGTFSCEYCPKTFKRPLSLYGHLKQHSPLLKKHRKGGMIQCRACPITFTNVQELLQHVKDNHSKPPESSPQTVIVKKEEVTTPAFADQPQSGPPQIMPQEGLMSSTTAKELKTGRSWKGKPYSLRDKARRDYLLDNDPMMDSDVNDVYTFDPNFEENFSEHHKLPHLQRTTALQTNVTAHLNAPKAPSKPKQTSARRLKGVQGLLKLRHIPKKKFSRKYKSSGLGKTWKMMLRKSRSKYHMHHFSNILRCFTRSLKGLQCKACQTAFRPCWKAVLHLKTSHLQPRVNGRCARATTKTPLPEVGHSSSEDIPTSSSKLGKNLFVKMEGDEKYQCNLCLETFRGKKSLINHLEMHKEVYEAGVRSFSENHANSLQRTSTKQELDAKVKDSDSHLSSGVASGPAKSQTGEKPSCNDEKSSHRKGGTIHHYAQLDNRNIPVQPSKSNSPSRYRLSKIDGDLNGKSIRSKRLVCKICKFPTFAMEEMKRHMKRHSKTLLKCDQCTYQTIEKRFIIRHIQTVHEQKRPYTCELCVYSTAYKHHLKRHYRSHCVDLLTCLKCSFCTLQETKLQEHMKEHDMSPNIVMCDDCGLTFASSKMLSEHLAETHHKIKSEEEMPSEKRDRSGFAANWWENLPDIDEEAIFEQHCCENCGFATEDNEELMSHMISEHLQGEQSTVVQMKREVPVVKERLPVPHIQKLNQLAMDLSVQCPQCGFITSSDQLAAHLAAHNSEETYACEHCPFETKELDALQNHKGKHVKHKVSLTCVLCGEVQTDVLSLRDHTRIHLIAISSNSPFRCSLCPFTTDSIEDGEYHLDQHNYVMEFKCQVCMYSSPTLSGLTSHRKLHRKINASTHVHKVKHAGDDSSV